MKYRLIKEYPGSPKSGTELTQTGNGWRCKKTDFSFFDYPSNYPEFFEKIVDRFDIHSVKRLSDGGIFTVGDLISSNKP